MICLEHLHRNAPDVYVFNCVMVVNFQGSGSHFEHIGCAHRPKQAFQLNKALQPTINTDRAMASWSSEEEWGAWSPDDKKDSFTFIPVA